MPTELPASALYSHPSLGRLWKKVHQAHSPFLHRKAVRLLYQKPAFAIRRLLSCPYALVALGCADGAKESLLLQKLLPPALLLAFDTNLSLARRAARRLPAHQKMARQVDLNSISAFLNPKSKIKIPKSSRALPRLLTLFGVLPNLDPLPLLRSIRRCMSKDDLLLLSANFAPGALGHRGALAILPQYDNRLTRNWLEAAIRRYRPKLPKGYLKFGTYSDPKQTALARIEARWMNSNLPIVVFSSRRPTHPQVESWIQASGLRRLNRWIEPRGEEGVWLVTRRA